MRREDRLPPPMPTISTPALAYEKKARKSVYAELKAENYDDFRKGGQPVSADTFRLTPVNIQEKFWIHNIRNLVVELIPYGLNHNSVLLTG